MHRRVARAWLGGSLLAALAWTGQDARADGPLGFTPGSRASQAKAEVHALSVPTPERARAWLHALTEEPHVAGTEADHKTALFVRDKLREWGWQAELAEYEVLLNYPVAGTVSLQIVRPTSQRLKVTEDAFARDKDSASLDAFPAFHGYGISGYVNGQVVYANLGRPEDFSALEKMGIEVKDRIVLVRYGGLFRGLKVLNAQKRGAKGVLIYSDPADDGYARGDIYPHGPYRPPSAIQRGSVQFLSLQPGDPSTPDGPSVKEAERLPYHARFGFPLGDPKDNWVQGFSTQDAIIKRPYNDENEWEKAAGRRRRDYFAAIPSLPISYEAATPILKALGGPNVPIGWQGGLPFAYHIGPGPVEVRFTIEMDYKVRTIWNVIATIKGESEPDRWVMIGNHRDAWVYGAVDPSSGTAATLEMCRAVGSAVKDGWKPRRTLVYASWDAEEYGLVGSTEWAEDHAEELDRKAVLMLNVDSAVSGAELALGGVPSLRDLALDAADGVTDPRTGKTLRALWMDRQRAAWANQEPVDLAPAEASERVLARSGPAFSPQLGPLGSGSDYTAFVDHLGIPAFDAGFHGHYGVYHSIYDDFFWMEKFGDPQFVTHATAARLYTLVAMRAAGAEVVPLRFTPYAEAIAGHLDELRRMAERKARSADKDPARPSPLAFEGLPDLVRSVEALRRRAAELDKATTALASRDGADPARLARVNDALTRVERAFLLKKGLPGRPWFKHAVYAPGLTTGYASWPLPGVRQALNDGDKAMLAEQVKALVERLDAADDAMRAASRAAEDNGPAGGQR
jgi:N-acetylated-alpha-linked acidic dipeptidase